MSQSVPTPVANNTPKPSWRSVMSRALLHPGITTFQTLVQEPGATTRRALVWYFVASALALALATPIQAAVDNLSNPVPLSAAELRESFGTPQSLLLGGALGGLVWLFLFICAVGFTQLVADVLGGKGSFQKLAYVSSAIWAPLTLTQLLPSIPVMLLVTLPLVLYGVILNLIALRAVNEFGWARTILAGAVVSVVNLGVTLLGVLLGTGEWMGLLQTISNR